MILDQILVSIERSYHSMRGSDQVNLVQYLEGELERIQITGVAFINSIVAYEIITLLRPLAKLYETTRDFQLTKRFYVTLQFKTR